MVFDMKKVLVITYYWPPSGGPGVQRILNFVKYLPDFGWQPVVLTVRNGEYPDMDSSLVEEVAPDLPVYHTRTLEPYSLYRMLVHRGKYAPIPTYVLTEKNKTGFMKNFAAAIRGNLFIPDAKIGWVPFALKKGRDIIASQDIRLIFSTSPPQTVNMIAKKIALKTSLKWVADLRDPWTDIFYYHELRRLGWAKKIDRYIEENTLGRADTIITVSPTLKQIFSQRITSRYEVIPNGFDPPSFSTAKKTPRSEKFRVVHTGNLAGNQNPEILWRVISSLLKENQKFTTDLSLEFYGNLHSDIIDSLQEFQLQEYTRFNPYIPHRQVVEVMQAASLLFFALPVSSYSAGILTSKLFDYIGAQRPILGIGPALGDAATILNELHAGTVCDYQDERGVKNVLEKWYNQWQKSGHTEIPTSPAYMKYSRQQQTGELAAIFDSVVSP